MEQQQQQQASGEQSVLLESDLSTVGDTFKLMLSQMKVLSSVFVGVCLSALCLCAREACHFGTT